MVRSGGAAAIHCGVETEGHLSLTDMGDLMMRSFWVCMLVAVPVALAADRANADTYVVIANQSGQDFNLNYNTPLPNGAAVWAPLNATVLGSGWQFEIVDTGRTCGDGWAIEFNMYDGPELYSQDEYCIHLAFAEIGCIGVHFGADSIGWSKLALNHCSSAWWDQQGSRAFDQILQALGAAGALMKK
jgi:hypothetical protein